MRFLANKLLLLTFKTNAADVIAKSAHSQMTATKANPFSELLSKLLLAKLSDIGEITKQLNSYV